jgi:hypothetical protein
VDETTQKAVLTAKHLFKAVGEVASALSASLVLYRTGTEEN